MCQAVDDIRHGDVGVQPSVVGHLRFFQICAVPNGVDVVIAFQLEVLVNLQRAVTRQSVPCFAKQSLRKEFCDAHCGLRPQNADDVIKHVTDTKHGVVFSSSSLRVREEMLCAVL